MAIRDSVATALSDSDAGIDASLADVKLPLTHIAALIVVVALALVGRSTSTLAGGAHTPSAASHTAGPLTVNQRPAVHSHTGSTSTGAGTATSLPGSAAAASTSAPAAGLPQPVTNVASYGATGNGSTDDSPAVQRALAAAEKTGGTLYFPPGHYMLNGTGFGGVVHVGGGLPLTVAGASASSVTLTATNSATALLTVSVDHTVVQDLTLDTQSSNARQALGIGANYVTVQRCTILGGNQFFAIYAVGAPGANPSNPQYHYGNQMLDDTISDDVQNDGFSWSFQSNSLIQNITHTGSRLALYMDQNVIVNNYTYRPGPQPGATDGFWISAPSSNITITNFTSYGSGGVMSDNGGRSNTNIVINNEHLLGNGYNLRVEGAAGLTINGCNFGHGNGIVFTGTNAETGILVQNCSALPDVRYSATAPVTATFRNDDFPPLQRPAGPPQTFYVYDTGVTFTVQGGMWGNEAGGFIGGKPASYTTSGLVIYVP